MGYKEILQLDKRTIKEWEELRENCLVYELTIPDAKTAIDMKGTQEYWNNRVPKDRNNWTPSPERLGLYRVSAVWENAKGTVKVIRAGKLHSSIFNREVTIKGFSSLDGPTRYNENSTSDIYGNIQVGTWLVAQGNYCGDLDRPDICFISNEKDVKDIKRILDVLVSLEQLTSENKFEWGVEDNVKTYGTLTLMEVLLKEAQVKEKLRRFQWIYRKERWDLYNSVKARLSMKRTRTHFEVRIKGLDGSKYFFQGPKDIPDEHSYDNHSIYELDYWLPFVYRDSGDTFQYQPKLKRKEILVSRFCQLVTRLSAYEFNFEVDSRRLVITRKETSSGASLNYINGTIVALNMMREKSAGYFLNGTPIVEDKPETKLPRKKMGLSKNARHILEHGLNGEIQDLEGEFPFHLNLVYKEKQRKWYIECAGKEYYIKGGLASLTKVKSAVKGHARIDYDKYSWGSQRSSRLIRDRLAELVGRENALEIVLQVKKMGALAKVLGGE